MAVLIATALLAACSGGGAPGAKPTEAAPPPEPAPHPLVGTWSLRWSWTHEGVAHWEDVLLTFTEAGRAIISTAAYADGQPAWTVVDSHAWSADADGTVVVKTGVYDHDNDWETPEVRLPPVTKSYYVVNDDTLLLHYWFANRNVTGYDEYSRAAPLASPVGEWEYLEDGRVAWEVTIGADGTFIATQHHEDGGFYSISGTGTLDLEGLYIDFVNLTSRTETREARQWGDGGGRVAFAPAPTGFVVSMPWNEDVDNSDYRENGHYWLLLEPKQ